MHHTFSERAALRCAQMYRNKPKRKIHWPTAIRKVLLAPLDLGAWPQRVRTMAIGYAIVAALLGVFSVVDLLSRWFAS